MLSAIRLPGALQRYLNGTIDAFLSSQPGRRSDFARPLREEALVPPHSVSWRILKNPIALFVGGTAAVILELAEPAVRAGVWEHTSFRKDPLRRLRRTGLAAMISVYGARSVAEPMIARVVQMHSSIKGTTAAGIHYSASDPRLLTWVHATASFGFVEAYSRYVGALSTQDLDAYYREGVAVSRMYGAADAPRSSAEMQALMAATRPCLVPSPIIFEFLQIMRETPSLPRPLRWMQPMLLRAAVELIPDELREWLGLTEYYGLRDRERWLMKWAAVCADRIVLPASPAVQACLRLGLPMNYLYAHSARAHQVTEENDQENQRGDDAEPIIPRP
ncbi:MAG TPA: oxygenase MpaB family protein [Steroidobacteraceae bacterium]|nr:oxygenase MpaB family protein [Steroidobacteraceae bacterium]